MADILLFALASAIWVMAMAAVSRSLAATIGGTR